MAIAIPLLAGPGAIIASYASTGWLYTLIPCLGAGLLVPLLSACLRFAAPIGRRLGRTGVNIATRLMGLMLVAIAVDFIADGVRQLFPGLGAPA